MTEAIEPLTGRAPREASAGGDRRPRSWWVGLAALMLLLVVGIASVLAMAPTAPAGPAAPAEAFSAARAMTHISAIADAPRPMGSTAAWRGPGLPARPARVARVAYRSAGIDRDVRLR